MSVVLELILRIIASTDSENKMYRKRSQLIDLLIFLIDLFSPINDFTKLSKEKQLRGNVFSCFTESRSDKVLIITKRNHQTLSFLGLFGRKADNAISA